MYDTVVRAFQESFPLSSSPFSLTPPTFILPLLENFHDASWVKPGRKADAMKSSPVKASRKLGKILFTFPQRAQRQWWSKLKVHIR